MSRDRHLMILLVVGLLLIGSAWLLPRLEWVEEDVPGRLSGEALRDSALAARRMVAALGYRTRTINDATQLAALPTQATLWVNQTLPDAAAGRASEQIAAWVRAGGHAVIAVPAPWQPKRLSEALGVRTLGQHTAKNGVVMALDGRTLQIGIRQCDVFTAPHPVIWSGSVRGYRPRADEDAQDNGESASDGQSHKPAGKQSNPHADTLATAVARYRVGAGLLTVLCDDRPMLNGAIGKDDNARFAATVLLDPSRDEVIFATQSEYPSLPRWLWQHASAALLTLAVLVALILWRAGTRFGAERPSPEASRPGLQLHLRGMAAFLLRQRQFGALLGGPRDELRRLLARLPGDADARLAEAAQRSGVPLATLRDALDSEARDTHDYQRKASVLARLADRLRTSRRSTARRKSR
ncbi:hypothetical protein GCM10025771_01580 [Niveibacterium umoris]|uniref:DUF4350 domain-containing protein n=1 Tax=Niveibacterium umoris TaxID=1193620 RepID=A0A840BSA1_9RHOO|nr:DUF4350 domain-containing protein [Niveibacterium umoris]MBB4014299.1 hypothetical protein [Niveibacterium umoris]